jgi:hypothetical protein
MRQYTYFEGVYPFMFISKESSTDIGKKCMNFVRQKVATSTTVCTVAHPTNSEHSTAFSAVDRLCDKREVSLCVHG